MANLTAGDRVLVTIVGQYLGQTTMNTYPYVVDTAPVVPVPYATAMAALNTALDAGDTLANTQRGCCPQNWIHVSTWCQVIYPTRLRKFAFAHDGPGLFAETDSFTANLQASIERYSEETGRREQGAVRIPIGTDVTCIEDGSVTPELFTALVLHSVQMKTPLTVSGYSLVPLVGVGKPIESSLKVFGCEAKRTVRVIRRRTLGLGI